MQHASLDKGSTQRSGRPPGAKMRMALASSPPPPRFPPPPRLPLPLRFAHLEALPTRKPVASKASSRNMSAHSSKQEAQQAVSRRHSMAQRGTAWHSVAQRGTSGTAQRVEHHQCQSTAKSPPAPNPSMPSQVLPRLPRLAAPHRRTCDWVGEARDGELPRGLPQCRLKVRGKQAGVGCGAHQHNLEPRVAPCGSTG